MMKDINFEKLYFERFDKENNIKIRISLWKVLCKNFFQQFVNIQDITLDLGAGYCEFINNIKCKEKYAVDLNEKIKTFASPEVKTIIKNVSDMSVFPENFFNIIFISNFLEHLYSKKQLLETILEMHRILKKEGKLLILSPNILYVKEHYWDFLDHNIPLTHNTIKELLLLNNFKIKLLIPKFLPYSTISKFPKYSILVKIYLKLPFVWHVLGKQFFIVAEK